MAVKKADHEKDEVKKTDAANDEKPDNGNAGSDVDVEVDYDLKELDIDLKDKEIEALSDKYKRLAAEYDNFRKRTAKEKAEIYANSIIEIVDKLIPVMDNLERAEKTLAQMGVKDVGDGVSMVIEHLKKTFEDLGITEIDCSDEFDPKCHEGVMHITDESYGENTIAEVFTKGYKIGDRVIRCAAVKVAN
jgi:molecular chaperone GrpE